MNITKSVIVFALSGSILNFVSASNNETPRNILTVIAAAIATEQEDKKDNKGLELGLKKPDYPQSPRRNRKPHSSQQYQQVKSKGQLNQPKK